MYGYERNNGRKKAYWDIFPIPVLHLFVFEGSFAVVFL